MFWPISSKHPFILLPKVGFSAETQSVCSSDDQSPNPFLFFSFISVTFPLSSYRLLFVPVIDPSSLAALMYQSNCLCYSQ